MGRVSRRAHAWIGVCVVALGLSLMSASSLDAGKVKLEQRVEALEAVNADLQGKLNAQFKEFNARTYQLREHVENLEDHVQQIELYLSQPGEDEANGDEVVRASCEPKNGCPGQ